MRRLLFVLALLAIGPSARLSAQPKERPDLVAPTDALSPTDQRKAFTVPPGFDVQLVAAEPDIGKPMQMAFDAKGRLWVATSRHYPFAVAPGKGTDKLYVLSDFGDDGKAKKVTLFADNLNIPIGIMPLPDCTGCIVSNIAETCEIVKLTDTNGDGKADKAETLFSGFGVRDTHGMVNSFTLMPDGWVYACHGYLNASKVKGKDGHEIEVQSGNMLRFRLDGSRIEVYTRGQVNPFGLAVDPWFNLYTADCHSKPMTALIPGAVYESFGKPHDGLGYGPNMIGYDPGGTGMCGLAWYDADHFPPEHRGVMYLGNVITNRVNAAKIAWTGATPNAVQQQDLIASSDRWFRPVDVKLGPDGAVYVSDFYNKIIGHYEVDLKHPGRDRDRGRIWRVIKKDAPPKMPFADLTKASSKDVDELLGHPNLTVRLLATNELIHRTDEQELFADKNDPLHTAHRRWVDEARSWRGPERKRLDIASNQPLVEAHLYRIEKAREEWAREHPGRPNEKRKSPHLIDVHPAVVRAAVEELASRPLVENIKPLVELIPKIQAGDTHLRHAARIALRNSLRVAPPPADIAKDAAADAIIVDVMLGLPTADAAKYIAAHLARSESAAKLPELVEHVGRHGSAAERLALLRHVRTLVNAPEDGKFGRGAVVLRQLLKGMQAGGHKFAPDDLRPESPDQRSPVAAPPKPATMAKDPAATRLFVESLALLPSVVETVQNHANEGSVRAYAALMEIAGDATIPDDPRGRAMDVLGRDYSGPAFGLLEDALVHPKSSAAIKEAAALALSYDAFSGIRKNLFPALKAAPYRVAVAAAVNMAGSRRQPGALFVAVQEGALPARVLQDKLVLERLKASKWPNWEKSVADLTKGLPAADARLAKLIQDRGAKFASVTADKAEGAKLFVKHCGACHAIGNTGGKIAPQLDGVGIRGLERVLEDTLDPNRNVDAAFRARVLNLADGTTKTGLLVKTDGQVLVMADDQGKEFRVPLKDVETNRETALSPMPANFGDVIPEADFFHLLAYLLDQKAKDAPKGEPNSFKPLFNGKDLTGWKAGAKPRWNVRNGELVGSSAKLVTEEEFGDIEFQFEYQSTLKGGNVSLRGAPLPPFETPNGEWAAVRVVQVGERTSAWVNGKLAVDHARGESPTPLPKKGAIGLHGGGRYRNLQVRELTSDEANAILRRDAAGFESVFNGKDFTGWAGVTENYDITDGAIVCKPKKGGNIYTASEYADFVARLEYKLPSGGNNGLAIRYPGAKKHAATEGMCEIQILDDDAPKYAKLDVRQFNGSAYGMAAAHRGYLRPVGEWNFMEVTAKGPRLQVELNGTRILDVDMSKVTEFKDNQPHPGKDRPAGHFGFCGHNDPVAFRNIEIKKLK